jgi:glycosyltransferase involved in cell wall biosynthesis
MRILFVSNLFPCVASKVQGIFTLRQVETATRLGADITVLFTTVWIPQMLQYLSSRYKDYDKKHAPLDCSGIRVITVPAIRWTRGIEGYRWDGLFIYHAAKKKVLSLHQKTPFDVIYGKGIFPSADAAVRFAKLLHIPAIGEGIGGDVNIVPDYSPAMYRHFLKTTQALDGAVADGKGVAERLSGVMHKDIPTIHGLVDLETFRPVANKTAVRSELNISAASLALLYVGSLQKEKGVYELINAFCKIREIIPHAVLNLCGSGTEYSRLLTLIAERKLQGSVHLVGDVDPADMHKWMQASDIFILPSYTEGMPNVVMEAMACGLPVISTAVGGLPEAIGSCPGAVLIEPRSVDLLASAIVTIGTNKELCLRMGAVARQKAEQKFGAEANCQKMLDYIKTVIARYKKHSQ